MRTRKDPEGFMKKLVRHSVAALAVEGGFEKWDHVSANTLTDLVISTVKKQVRDIKAVTELNGRTDSNFIDAMSALNASPLNLTRDDILYQIKNPLFQESKNNPEFIKQTLV